MDRYPLPRPLSPEEVLRRLCRGDRPFLLDGAADADGLGRMTYGGCDPVTRHVDADATYSSRRQVAPLRRLEDFVARSAPCLVVGLLTYDLGRAVERLPGGPADDIGVAPVDVAAYDAVYAADARTGEAAILAASPAAAWRLRRVLEGPAPPPLPGGTLGVPRFAIGPEAYRGLVARVREYLLAGDCYQVNLCRRLVARIDPAQTLPLYLRLRHVAPAPLAAYLQLDPRPGDPAGPIVLSNSPELLLDVDLRSGAVETRPIKGTRPRGRGPAEDRRLCEELVASEKDLAEHLMIVDLLRNDLGRVARVGSVGVRGYARALTLPTVHHLVSTVHAELAAGAGWHNLLAAVVPGGSITGAPKVRAMEIIDELEPVRRGPFYGSVCLMTPAGGKLSLCIRTAVVRGGELVLSVGGGIVVDSTPQGELEETEVKAAAFLRALG
jgi:para-aminobenzoate synthetase component 1